MNSLNNFINEKLIINSKTKISTYDTKKWDRVIDQWINSWVNDDYEYLIELIDLFLKEKKFDNYSEYGNLLKYENNIEFKRYLSEKFISFKKNSEEQIKNLKI